MYYVPLRGRRTLQNLFLLLASLFFYAYGEPLFVLVMIASIIVNYGAGLLLDRARSHENKNALCRLILIADCVFNLGILFVFKYLIFTAGLLSSATGLTFNLPVIRLPIGISFFTFQALSYVIDVYREKAAARKNILDVGLYISFFPQLIAGPIVRYETIEKQIHERRETADLFFNGFARFVMGLSKKVLLANSFAYLADEAHALNAGGLTLSAGFAWLGAIAYSLQIYFDFSGYSDMAIGLGSMFGFKFLENFDYPYAVKSVTDFWRHWHISLGSWFRDYVFIPLGGSRTGPLRLVANLLVVWFLTGLWHGANLTFIVWGLLYFVLLTFEKLSGIRPGHLITLFFVNLGWVLFRAESLTDAVRYIRAMFAMNENPVSDGIFTGYLTQNLVLLIIGCVLSLPLYPALKKRIGGSKPYALTSVAGLVLMFVLSVCSLVSNAYNPFIYFNF